MLSDHSSEDEQDNQSQKTNVTSPKRLNFSPPPDLPKDEENPFSVAMHSPPGSPPIVSSDRKQTINGDDSLSAVQKNDVEQLNDEAADGRNIEIAVSQKSSQHTNAPPPFDVPNDETNAMNIVDQIRNKFAISNELVRASIAEMFCTGFLIFGGESVSAQFILSQRKMDEWNCVAIGWGIALIFAVMMGFRISGSHLNPAVSFFQLTQGKINIVRFVMFVIAQNIGAFFGAMMVYIVYYDAINAFDKGNRSVTGPTATASIFATYPAPHLGTLNGMIDQIIGTAVLCIGVAAIVDRRNRIPPFLQPAFIGTLLIFIGMGLSLNCGYAINPARDFGPRLFSLIIGYGWRVFSYRNYKWFWIPIVCPMIGGAIGAWLYEFFIGFHIHDDPETSYVHKILDDRNPDGQLREIHVIEKKPYSEIHSDPDHDAPTSYRNM